MSATLTRDLVLTHTRALKLPGMARTFEGLGRQARDAHWPHEDYLQEVIGAGLAPAASPSSESVGARHASRK